jgi:hypothetical protein
LLLARIALRSGQVTLPRLGFLVVGAVVLLGCSAFPGGSGPASMLQYYCHDQIYFLEPKWLRMQSASAHRNVTWLGCSTFPIRFRPSVPHSMPRFHQRSHGHLDVGARITNSTCTPPRWCHLMMPSPEEFTVTVSVSQPKECPDRRSVLVKTTSPLPCTSEVVGGNRSALATLSLA